MPAHAGGHPARGGGPRGRLIERFLASDGPLTRAQMAGRLEAAGVRTGGRPCVPAVPDLAGPVSVRGPVIGKRARPRARPDWLGAPPATPDQTPRSAGSARPYLVAGHAPATDRDLAKWAGRPLRDAARRSETSRPNWTRATTAGPAGPACRTEQDGPLDWPGRPGPRRSPARAGGSATRVASACSTHCFTAGSPAGVLGRRTSRSRPGGCSRSFRVGGRPGGSVPGPIGRPGLADPAGTVSVAHAAPSKAIHGGRPHGSSAWPGPPPV